MKQVGRELGVRYVLGSRIPNRSLRVYLQGLLGEISGPPEGERVTAPLTRNSCPTGARGAYSGKSPGLGEGRGFCVPSQQQGDSYRGPNQALLITYAVEPDADPGAGSEVGEAAA